jgi:aminoglycoside phosphotransferase (APT) family kinase protein
MAVTTEAHSADFGLEPQVGRWIRMQVGGDIVAGKRVPAGGRHGWLLDVKDGTGAIHGLFLQQARKGAGDTAISAFMGFEKEAEVYRALAGSGIPIPKVWGLNSDLGVLLLDRVKGVTWMHPPADPVEQLSVAQDFIRHIATWHRLDPRDLDLPSFKPVRTAREHQKARLAEFRLRAEGGGEPIEPLLRISLEWLEANLPDYEGPVVLVQGDTGPGNFMYADGRVTGIIDWELAHLGDPMDDVAWMSWRTVQHTFTDFAARMAEYEALSGHKLDEKRVNYYRVNACVLLAAMGSGQHGGFGLPAMGPGRPPNPNGEPVAAEADRAADGSAFIFTTLHRRMRLEALAAAMGLHLPSREIAEQASEPEASRLYDQVLEALRSATPRIEDRTASALVKGVARTVKYLKETARNAALFEAHELDSIGRLLGARPASLVDGRQALYAAAVERRVSDEDYIRYHWDRLIRDDFLMRTAAGAVYQRTWPKVLSAD